MPKLPRAALLALPFLASLAFPAVAQVDVVVDLASQTMTATRADGERADWKVSTGRAGFETPRGEYGVERMALDYHSRKYDDAPMPYSIFFKGGFAIHGTNHSGLGRPASHGCVRLSVEHAALLYDWVGQEGGRIRIEGSLPRASGAAVASAGVRRPRHASYGTARALHEDGLAEGYGYYPGYERSGRRRASYRYDAPEYYGADY